MSAPFIGEIRLFAGNFAPMGWAYCDGTLMSIADNPELYQLIGTTYGGDGQSSFALPDLRGRLAVHAGTGSSGTPYVLGEMGGTETVTLTVNQIPAHSHVPIADSDLGDTGEPQSTVWAKSALELYTQSTADTAMRSNALATSGGSQPHENLPPYLGVNYIISLYGIFPS